MDNIFFYKKNGRLVSYVKTPHIKTLSEDKTRILLQELEKGKYRHIYYFSTNISFEVEGIKVTLKNKKDFYKDPRFKNIISAVKSKKYKLQVGVMAFLLAGATVVGTISVVAINKKDESIVPDTSISSETETDYSTTQKSQTTVVETKKNQEVKKETESTTKEETTVKLQKLSEDDLSILKIGSESNSEKAVKTRKEYKQKIDKYAKMYNLNPDVMLSIATQERGVHATTVDDGGAIGLMQIQVAVWDNQSITAYNTITGETEKINITLDKLKDLDFNIKTGCAIFQNYLKEMDGNYFLAVQCYNMGPNSVSKILDECSLKTGKSIDEIKKDYNNLDWFNYVNGNYNGDPNYVKNVYRYCESGVKTK